jgi:hypothetical protein
MKKPRVGDFSALTGSPLPVIKPLVGFQTEIEQQVRRFPFEKNVFLMLRFREANQDLSDFIIETLREAGLNGVRADQPDWNITNNVYNPVAAIYCCKYGIALFDEAEPNQAYNPNVIYELGMMQCLGREVLILRSDSLPSVPFDLIKDLCMPYRGALAARTNVRKWLQRIAPAGLNIPTMDLSGEAELENAAVTAPASGMDTVVSAPEHITTAEFNWTVSSKGKKTWKVSTSIKLANSGGTPTALKIQALFLDLDGFALFDISGAPAQALQPGGTLTYESSAAISMELARRIQHVLVTVTTV